MESLLQCSQKAIHAPQRLPPHSITTTHKSFDTDLNSMAKPPPLISVEFKYVNFISAFKKFTQALENYDRLKHHSPLCVVSYSRYFDRSQRQIMTKLIYNMVRCCSSTRGGHRRGCWIQNVSISNDGELYQKLWGGGVVFLIVF